MKKGYRYLIIFLSIVITAGSYFGSKKFEEYVDNSEGQLVKLEYHSGASDSIMNTEVKTSDSWFKALPEDFALDSHFKSNTFPRRNDVDLMECIGQTIEVTLNNTSEYRVNRWYIEWTAPEDLYLDKAWNGTVEIHQFGGENVDEITANDAEPVGSKIEYVPCTELYLVPLAKGDKVIYKPGKDEYPLVESVSDEGKYTDVTIGMILYTEGEDFKFNDFTIYYYVVKALNDYPIYNVLCALTLIGAVFFIGCVVFMFAAERYESMHRHDMEIISQAIETFAKFIDSKDTTTHNHSYRVAEYSRLIAKKLKMSDREIEEIYYIGLLHDTGKVEIDDAILNKPGRLTTDEYEIIKSHTTKGAEVLKDFTAIPNLTVGALYHHERYDGKGYPTGIIGEEIPLVARIICVADAYDAMSSNRCYRRHLDKEAIIEQLVINKGKQFDPDIVDIFLQCIEEGEV